MSVLDFATLGADHLTALLASEDALKQVLAIGRLQRGLETVEEQVEELLGVFLLRDDGRVAVELLEGEAETEGIVVHPLTEL